MLAATGTQAREEQELAFLAHAAEKHGFHARKCPSCRGVGRHANGQNCHTCDGEGVVFSEIKDESCGPDCLVAAWFEQLRRSKS